jgi:hypothetical protein
MNRAEIIESARLVKSEKEGIAGLEQGGIKSIGFYLVGNGIFVSPHNAIPDFNIQLAGIESKVFYRDRASFIGW